MSRAVLILALGVAACGGATPVIVGRSGSITAVLPDHVTLTLGR